jgi:hypothetical protein
MSSTGKRTKKSKKDKGQSPRNKRRKSDDGAAVAPDALEYPPYPTGVKIIARRNRHNHFAIPRKDTTVCGITYERVMIDSGCNTILLPFPDEGQRSEILRQFHNASHRWEIAWPGGTGGIHCPVLKIFPSVADDIGVMKFGEYHESPMPFLRFHLGTDATTWLVNNPHRLDRFNIAKLHSFLRDMGDNVAQGRTTAIIGQMLLRRLCVVQVGIVMFMMEAADASINPLRLHNECIEATNALVENYINFDDLFDDDNEFYDRDGVTPPDED